MYVLYDAIDTVICHQADSVIRKNFLRQATNEEGHVFEPFSLSDERSQMFFMYTL